jgi:HEAT repeat protein
MKIFFFLVSFLFTPFCRSQEMAQKPNLFPPISQILGDADQPMAARKRPADFSILITRLRSSNVGLRQQAVNDLGVPGNIRAVPYLGSILLQFNAPLELRVAAAMALGRIGNWRILGFLKQSLKDSAKEVRFASALAMGKTRSLESLPPLINALQRDPDWWVRFAAAVALGENSDPIAVEALGRCAESEKEWQVRMQAVRSLGQIGSSDAAAALAKPLGDPDASVRAATAMALGDIGGEQSLDLLAAALKAEPDDFTRRVISDTVKTLLSRP